MKGHEHQAQPGTKNLRHAVKGGTTRLKLHDPPFEQLLPDEEHSSQGILRADTANLLVPVSLIEAGGERPHGLMPGLVTRVIIIAGLIFISVIAWLVSRMPEK